MHFKKGRRMLYRSGRAFFSIFRFANIHQALSAQLRLLQRLSSDNGLCACSPLSFLPAADLGLPSGLKWAAGNIGAKTETDTGLYFDWGETTGHSLASDYIFSDDVYSAQDVSKFVSTGNDLILPQKYDAAYTNLGSDWRMPTKTDIEELLNGCTSQWMTDYEGSGVAGTLLTSKSNGKTLFFSATGKNYGNGNINWYGSCGLIWSSSYFWGDVWVIRYTRVECQLSIDNQRFAGLQVRGVCE